ncbi:MAG: YceH family protein [Pyrinomonadaceae bacterium]|nr:YceH family protein [Pyrinomonadaceae bacterium]
MPTMLTDVEIRVLGALVEKQLTTPEYYPLTLHSLTVACNQKNNRNPVTAYDENTVAHALETLREKSLSYVFHGSSSRVPKYKHVMPEVMHLSSPELAVMGALMLRGPQTVGELRGSASRFHEFSGLEQVEATLNELISKEPESMVVRLPRQPGQKDARFVHLLSGPPSPEFLAEVEAHSKTSQPRLGESDKVEKLQLQIEGLKEEFRILQQQFAEFKKQFE